MSSSAQSPASSPEEVFEQNRIGLFLTERGRKLWAGRSQLRDTTPTLSDAPARGDDDLLGRKAFSDQLVQRILSMRAVDRSAPLFIHLHGPWGSGKTSLLNMIGWQLGESDTPYLVAEYNAWQYQRIEPPWWSLIGAITDQIGRKLWSTKEEEPHRSLTAKGRCIGLFVWQLWFRLWSVKAATIAAGLAAAAWGLYSLIHNFSEADDSGIVSYVSGLLPLLGGIFAAGLTVFGILFPTPEEAADRYVGSRADPLLKLQKHISRLIRWLAMPVVVFIDDLDRCDADVVVRLLEGIQTLFRGAPVTFVVAADRRWVHQAFVTTYKDFQSVASTRARPLGYLFLEKTFQLSVSVPPVDQDTQRRYWDALLRIRRQNPAMASREMLEQKKREVADISTEPELLKYARNNPDPISRQAVMHRLAAPDIEYDVTRHRLEKFALLLEPNPRAMKRLVMAYGANQAVDIMLGTGTDGDQLALWTILAMRWPRIADWLERHSEYSGKIVQPPNGTDAEIDLDDDLLATLRSKDFRDILDGGGVVTVGLDAATLKSLGRRGSAL